jgi:hypothetical protein
MAGIERGLSAAHLAARELDAVARFAEQSIRVGDGFG